MTSLLARARRRGPSAAVLAALAALLPAGCMDSAFLAKHGVGPPPTACQVATTWYPEVVTTPDPAHGGTPVRGIAGRVYLFGREVRAPLTADGAMVVDLYDESAGATRPKEGPRLPLEEWRFDRDTLKRLLKQDAVGWGYTVFLPWSTYKPEITHVRLTIRFEPVGGAPLFNDEGSVVLRRGETTSWQNTDVPALRAQGGGNAQTPGKTAIGTTPPVVQTAGASAQTGAPAAAATSMLRR